MIVHKRMTEQQAHEEAVKWYRLAQQSTPDISPPIPKDYGCGLMVYTLSVGFDLHYLIFKPNESKETNKSN